MAAAKEREDRKAIGTEARPAVYEWIHVMESVHGKHRSVAEIAQQRGVDPVEAMIDLGLETDMEVFFLQPIANENQDIALELIKNPRTVVTFSDSGAHVSQLMDASLQTHLLAHWVRDEAGAHAGRGRAHAQLRHRDHVGLLRPRPRP